MEKKTFGTSKSKFNKKPSDRKKSVSSTAERPCRFNSDSRKEKKSEPDADTKKLIRPGTRIKVIASYYSEIMNETGILKYVDIYEDGELDSLPYAIEFDNHEAIMANKTPGLPGLHSCNSHCKDRTGLWLGLDEVEICRDYIEKPIVVTPLPAKTKCYSCTRDLDTFPDDIVFCPYCGNMVFFSKEEVK